MSATKISVKKNFIYNIMYQVLTIITPLLVTPYISRVLHASGIGNYGYAYATANYFVLFTMLGLNNYGNRTIARYRDDKVKLSSTFISIYCMQVFTSVVCVFTYCLFVVNTSNSPVFLGMLLYVISAGVDITWFFQGLEEFRLTVSRNAIIKLVTTLCIFIFVKNEDDLLIYTIIMSGSILLSQISLWPFLQKYICKTKINLSDIFIHFKPNFILFIPAIAVSFYRIMDKIMIGTLSSTLEVGYYESTDKLIAIPLCVVSAFGTVMMPRMANIVQKKTKKEISNIVMLSVALSVMISAPIMTGMMGIISDVVPLFYGKGYEKCIVLFYILLPSTLFISMANVLRTQILIPFGLDKIYVKSCLYGAITNVVINIMLIPKYGSIGAAIGTLTTEVVVFGIQICSTKEYLNVKQLFNFIQCNVVFSMIMGIVVYFVPCISENSILNILLKICIGVILYVGEMLLFLKWSSNNIVLRIRKNINIKI